MMGYIVNVDVGGTFIDFYVGKEDKSITTKTPTTHYDLSVGFMRGLEECAAKEGITLQDFLRDTEVIKYCTTLGTNALIELSGPRLGLITTRGFEDTIFIGRGGQWAGGGRTGARWPISRTSPTSTSPPPSSPGAWWSVSTRGSIIKAASLRH